MVEFFVFLLLIQNYLDLLVNLTDVDIWNLKILKDQNVAMATPYQIKVIMASAKKLAEFYQIIIPPPPIPNIERIYNVANMIWHKTANK